MRRLVLAAVVPVGLLFASAAVAKPAFAATSTSKAKTVRYGSTHAADDVLELMLGYVNPA